jgi:hypothetical protein
VLAKRSQARSIRIRYYLSTPDGLRRIPERLHHQLINKEASLPNLKSSEQRILEVIARPLTATTYAITARGLIYAFDIRGFLQLDIDRYSTALSHEPREGNVIDLERIIKRRRAREKNFWKPSKEMIHRVKQEIIQDRPKNPLPILRAPNKAR